MKRWITMLLVVSMLLTFAGVRPVVAAANDFDEFFEQNAFFLADHSGRVYVNGSLQFMNGPVEMRDGVLYVSSVMLGQLLKTDHHLIGNGLDIGGQVIYIASKPGQNSWSYGSGDPVAFGAWVGQTRCVVNDEERSLRHAPYITEDNGTFCAMLPLRDVCQVIGRSCTYLDGLLIVGKYAPTDEWLAEHKETLAHIKEQLSQPFAGENPYYLFKQDGHIILNGGEQEQQILAFDEQTVICQALDSQGQETTQWDDTEELVTTVALKNIVSGEGQVIAALPNRRIGYAETEKTWYRFYTYPRVTTVPGGHLIEVTHFGGNAQSSSDYLFYVTDDGQVVLLSEDTVNDFFVTDDALYYNLWYIDAPVGALHGWIYRYEWGDDQAVQIGQDDLNYRQIAYIGDDTIIAAASPFDAAKPIQLYQLNVATGEQQLLDETMLDSLATSGGRYFQISGDEICYWDGDGQKLRVQQLNGDDDRVLDVPRIKENVQPIAGGFYFVGLDDHIYFLPHGAQETTDLSEHVIGRYVSDEERIFYSIDGYQAGVYMWKNGQTMEILAGQIADMALDDQGVLVILPRDACGYYDVYDQGKLEQRLINS